MDPKDEHKPRVSRRGFLTASVGLAASGAAALGGQTQSEATKAPPANTSRQTEPFFGEYQGGILTPVQRHTYFAALDLTTDDRKEVVDLLRAWTAMSVRLTAGETGKPMGADLSVPAADSGDTLEYLPERLTLTFGFGAGLFSKAGKDRYGLAARKPAALVDLPQFTGDQLIEAKTGGDILIQACADDPQVAFHAVRQLIREIYERADVRWVQSGFLGNSAPGQTPRNLMGFKDGTNNPNTRDAGVMAKDVWVADEGPAWMKKGSYVVVRRIRIALEHWDRSNVSFQEHTIGRQKYSGAPLTGKKEFDKPDYDAADKDGNPVIAENAHIRMAAPSENDGAEILRRPFSYNDGISFTAERWPPWRQAMEFDSGLLFVCYQRDPRTGFIKIFERMSKLDALNQFVTHTGGGLFACPGGIQEGQYIGQALFEG